MKIIISINDPKDYEKIQLSLPLLPINEKPKVIPAIAARTMTIPVTAVWLTTISKA